MRSHTFSDIEPYKRLGEAVRARRHKLKITQASVGDLAGCGRLFVSYVEQGKPTVRLDKLVSVLAVLGLQLTVSSGSAKIEVDAD